MVVTPDEKGGGAVDATAGAAGLARADHYIRLTRNAHVVSDGRTLDADELTVQMTADDKLIQNMALRGNSRITGAAGSGPEGMSARDIDLTYAPDGRTLQQARLMENAVATLAGAGQPPRQISARLIDLTMGPDGTTVTGLTATQNVQVDLPAAAGAPARRINAAALNAGGATGLQTATFTGGVTFVEMRPPTRGAAASERTGRSLRLIVATQPGLGAIEQADFRGNVQIVDGSTVAEGQRAVYKVAGDSFDLAPSAGDPGPPPSVNDGRTLVNARTISVGITSKNLSAETDVRSSLQPGRGSKPAPAGGRGAAPSPGARLPSMFKENEPVLVTSNRLQYDGAAGVATYTGNARLFQGQTSIVGDTIVLDDKSSNLTARGRVRTSMPLEETDSKTKEKRTVDSIATGDTMVYEDAKRLATYTTGPSAKAHIVGPQGDVTAEIIRLYMKKGVNELERAEADGDVTVKEGYRTATGDHLKYTTADETYILDGTPVEVVEKTPTRCDVTIASSVSFQRSTVGRTTVRNNGVTPAIVKQCAPGQSD
jgi:lipopolysaccharide export system protein LptA